jgi:hypothetical protein
MKKDKSEQQKPPAPKKTLQKSKKSHPPDTEQTNYIQKAKTSPNNFRSGKKLTYLSPNKPDNKIPRLKSTSSAHSHSRSFNINDLVSQVPLIQNQFSDLSVTDSAANYKEGSMNAGTSKGFKITRNTGNDKYNLSTKQFLVSENHTFGKNSIRGGGFMNFSPSLEKEGNPHLRKILLKTRQSCDSNSNYFTNIGSDLKEKGREEKIAMRFPHVNAPTIEFSHNKSFRNSQFGRDVSESREFAPGLAARNEMYNTNNAANDRYGNSPISARRPQRRIETNIYQQKVNAQYLNESINQPDNTELNMGDQRIMAGIEESALRIQVRQLEEENGFLRNEIEDFKNEILKIEDAGDEMLKKQEDLEEFVFFLKGKYKDNISLESLRGKKIEKLRKELSEFKNKTEEKDRYILNLFNDNNLLSQKLNSLAEAFDSELHGVHAELDRERQLKELVKSQMNEHKSTIDDQNAIEADLKAKLSTFEIALNNLKNNYSDKEKELAALVIKFNEKENDFRSQNQDFKKLQDLLGKERGVPNKTIDCREDQLEEEIERLNFEHKKEIMILRKEIDEIKLREKINYNPQHQEVVEKPFKILFDKKIQTSPMKEQLKESQITKPIESDHKNNFRTFLDILCTSLDFSYFENSSKSHVMISKDKLQTADTPEHASQLIVNAFNTLCYQLSNENQLKNGFEAEIDQMNKKNLELLEKVERFADAILRVKQESEKNEKNLTDQILRLKIENSKILANNIEFEAKYSQNPMENLIKNSNVLDSKIDGHHRRELTNECLFKPDSDEGKNTNAPKMAEEIEHLKKKLEQSKTKYKDRINKQDEIIQKLRHEFEEVLPNNPQNLNELLSQNRSLEESNKVYETKIRALSKQLGKSAISSESFTSSKKVFFESLNPEETVVVFRRFLIKVANSQSLLSKIKSTLEFQELIESISH